MRTVLPSGRIPNAGRRACIGCLDDALRESVVQRRRCFEQRRHDSNFLGTIERVFISR